MWLESKTMVFVRSSKVTNGWLVTIRDPESVIVTLQGYALQGYNGFLGVTYGYQFHWSLSRTLQMIHSLQAIWNGVFPLCTLIRCSRVHRWNNSSSSGTQCIFDAYRSFVDSACSRNNPIEDDLVLKVGNRGRNKGEFTNPQGVAMSPDGKAAIFLAHKS